MIFNIPVGGSAKTIVTVYGAASETVTLAAKNGKTFTTTTDATGKGEQLEIPVGVYTISGSHSGYSKSVTVAKDTTAVYAMPNGTIVYWYGYAPYEPVGKGYAPNKAYFNPQPGITSNRKALTIEKNERSIRFTQGGASGTYCGSAVFEDIETSGGVLTFISTGKSANTSAAIVIFSYAKDISQNTFMPDGAVYLDYQQTEATIPDVSAGTYDIAISAQNNVWNFAGSTEVYAIYIEE